MRRVGGAALLPSGRWRLYLDCGHMTERPASAGNPPRPPRRAMCDTCEKKEKA